MRILHTSDWHFGMSLNNMSMISDQAYFVEQLLEIVDRDKIEAVLVAGDIFDSTVSTSEAISLYNKTVTTLCGNRKVSVIIIAGNHDGAARLASCNELLKVTGLHITGKLVRNIEPTALNDVLIYAIPYFNIDEVRVLYPEADVKNYEQAMQTVCDNIRVGLDEKNVNIIVAHAFVSGAALSESDKTAMLGTTSMVSKEVFSGFNYTALGHLHRPQNIGENVRYSGSPLKYSFGEHVNNSDRNNSVTIIDTDNIGLVKTVDILPKHRMQVIKGEYCELLEGAEYSDDFVKVEVTDRYIGAEGLASFRIYYPNLLSISGKMAVLDNEQITLTIDEVASLSPEELLKKFFLETLQCEPSVEQIELFKSVLTIQEDGLI